MESNQGPAATFINTALGQILRTALVSTVLFSNQLIAAPIAFEKVFALEFEAQPIEICPRIESAVDRTQIFSSASKERTVVALSFNVSGNSIGDAVIGCRLVDGTRLFVGAFALAKETVKNRVACAGNMTYAVADYPVKQVNAGKGSEPDSSESKPVSKIRSRNHSARF